MWKRWSRNDFLYKVYFKLLFIIINFHYPILLDGIFSTCFHNGFLRSDLGILWLHEWALQYWWKSLDWNDILPFIIVYYRFVYFDSYLLTLNQLTIKRSGTCFICFQIMSDWEVSDHLHLSLNKFGYLIPGSNCLWGMWVVLVCMEGGRRYPYDTGRRKCI